MSGQTPPPNRRRRLCLAVVNRERGEQRAPPPGVGRKLEGSGSILSSLIVPVFTLVGILATGILTFTSTVFKDNLSPSANIRMYIGRTPLLASPGTTAILTNTIPLGHKISFFAEQAIDPDGPNEELQKRWSITSDAGTNECRGSMNCAGSQLTWAPATTGHYLVQLHATDYADCPAWRVGIFGRAGCNKTIDASTFFRVIASRRPVIVLQDHPDRINVGASVKLDASQSYTFDDQTPSFQWRVNGIRRATTSQVEIASTDARRGQVTVLLNAADPFGNEESREIVLTLAEPNLAQTATVGSQPVKSVQTSPSLLCQGGEKYVMTRPLSVQEAATCKLPMLLVTAGYPLELKAGTLEATSSTIVSFDPASVSASGGADGLPGAPGANGVAEGEPGREGAPGSPGGPGAPGSSAGRISLTATSFQGQLRIDNSGQNGGAGGFGGLGGKGGDGARGAPAASGLLDCRRGPGRGGNGGGRGGDGGAAGTGGAAAPVIIAFEEVATDSTVEANTAAGLQGNSGLGGRGGDGGRGAPEGPATGFCGGAGRQGLPGPAGASGNQGAAASPGEEATISGKFGTAAIDPKAAVKLLAS